MDEGGNIEDEEFDYEYNNHYSGARGLLAEMEDAVEDGMIDPEVEDIINSAANMGNKVVNNA
jgi:hypothetical protein